ncbi:MAG: ABC transporter permease [Firmicutes bacterium]|nr:ABC transporter permease [Bacillota bacterium]
MNRRLLAIIKKEFIQMRRDKLTLAMMIVLPFIQLLIFGYAINTDVKNLPMAVYDQSETEESRQLIQSFTNSKYFYVSSYLSRYNDITYLIDSGKVKLGLIIDKDYAKDLKSGNPAKIQVLVDATDPQVASSVISNAGSIGNLKNIETLLKNQKQGARFTVDNMPVNVQIRGWYNPDLVSANYIVPGLVGVILSMTMMMITSMAVVKERETGTLEQLITTPIKSSELMIGKVVPYITIGYVQMTIALVVGALIFKVPVKGNLLLLYVLAFLHIACYLALGLLISTNAKTQMQAIQMSFFIFLPTMLLSGYMFPREGMPEIAQYLGNLLPLTFFLQILRAIILKGAGLSYLWHLIIPMIVLMCLMMGVSILKFKKSLD